jgi:hypothetical protein
MSTKRRPRYQRLAKTKRKSFNLRERDILIARYVHKYRFLNSHHLRALIRGNNKKITERLSQLYDQGILAKPPQKLGLTALYKPDVYELGRAGEALLRLRGFLNPSRQRWIAKNREGANRSVAHSLMIADLMVSIEVSCRYHGHIALIEPSEIVSQAPQGTRALDNPYVIPARPRYVHPDSNQVHNEPVGVIPDKVFGLRHLDSGTVQYFFFEADTGSVSLTDRNAKRHTALRRLASYLEIASSGRHRDHFGIPEFIVLFLTNSGERVSRMCAMVEHLTNGSGSPRFLFRSHPRMHHPTRTFVPLEHYLTLPWKRSGRSNISLLTLLQGR